MRALVTGGAGFIGSHLTEALIQGGHDVLVLDDLSRGKAANVPAGARLVTEDLRSEAARSAIQAFRPEVVHHHAAQIDVRASVADPVRDAEVNVAGTISVLAAAAGAGAGLIVFASSGGAIYGEQERYPASEDHPIRAESPYGVAKRCGELYLEYFARSRGLRAVMLRYANVYGPRQDPHGEAGVVAIFAGKMLRGEIPVVNGDGCQTRDYVYVGDVVRANLACIARGEASGPYNIGTGIETDVLTLVRRIAEHTGHSGQVQHAPAKPGEQRRSVLDPARARAELGWSPAHDLSEGLARTIAWFSAGGGRTPGASAG